MKVHLDRLSWSLSPEKVLLVVAITMAAAWQLPTNGFGHPSNGFHRC